jgi:hypothetical protein
MKLLFCIFIILFPYISFSNNLTGNETIINKTIFLDKFLVKNNYLLPSNQSRLIWYSEKNRLIQVNKKLEILSELGINSRNLAQKNSIAELFLKMPASGITKNLNLDPRWLEVNPKHNPVLRKGDRVVFHNLNNKLYFFTGNDLCKVSINSNLNIFDYLDICEVKVDSSIWIIDSKGNYKKFGVSDWNTNEHIPIGADFLVISDLFEFQNKLLFEKIINWISHNFDYQNINFAVVYKSIISKNKSTIKDLVKTHNNVGQVHGELQV